MTGRFCPGWDNIRNSLELTILCIGEIIVVKLLNIDRVHFVRFLFFRSDISGLKNFYDISTGNFSSYMQILCVQS